ncbi:MAG: IS66 family transposase [Planctomycetaceae bacterium]|nr:IS66 family transposase [Planctomycetaceae bacterium]
MPPELSPPSWPEAAPVPFPDRHRDAPTCSAPSIPLGPCPICPRLAQEFEPWRQAAYYKAMWERASAREAQLKQEIAGLQAQLRRREQQLFGRKADSTATVEGVAPPARSPRPRGQQRGRPGPKRRDYSHLPAVEQVLELPAEQQRCAGCGQPFAAFPGTDETTVLEIEVRAPRRISRRRRYRPTCSCGTHPGIVTAPAPAKVIPKSILGVSIWVTIVLDKFLFYRPTYRLLEDLRTQGLDLSQGTLTDGLRRLLPLFKPVYDKLVEHSQEQTQWHADETRWLVFATWEGKVGYRWYLWVFHAADVVVFVLSPGRSHETPEEHLGPVEEGILIVDRYAAYQAMAQVKDGIILLAFCWAHVRRDFLTVARSWPDQEAWALGWVERIGALYDCNDRRLEAPRATPQFAVCDQEVRRSVAEMEQQREAELAETALHPARRQVLESLRQHWPGLTLFVDHPEVAMDNNTAERSERGPVVGRKNYYGSGSVWSGRLAAMLFSLFQTLALWGINPRVWLTAYLSACAEAGGQAPAQPEALLPWNLSEEQRQAWSLEPQSDDSS